MTKPPPPVLPRSQSNQELSSNKGSGGSDKAAAQQEENQLLTIQSATFMRSHWAKEAGYWLLSLLTLGLLALVCHWYPELQVRLRYIEVGAADPRAEAVLVAALNGAQTLVQVLALDLTDLTKGWRPVRALRAALMAGGRRSEAEALAAIAASPRMFMWRHERFWFRLRSGRGGVWLRREFDAKRAYGEIHRLGAERVEETLDDDVALDRAFARALTYGENQLDIDAPAFPALVLAEVLKPFFAFQAFSFTVWVMQAYYTYLYVVVTLSVVTILQAAYQEYQNLKALERLAKADGVINRIRLIPALGAGGGGGGAGGGGSLSMGGGGGSSMGMGASLGDSRHALAAVPVCCSSLQPGDVVHISTNMVLPCDVLLLTGSCVMSEAMLTGESAPVLKAALPLDSPTALLMPDSDRDSKHILFSGTKVLQAKGGAAPPVALNAAAAAGGPDGEAGTGGPRCLWEFPVSGKGGGAAAVAGAITFSETPALGLVLKTGFSTARGQLIRGILFPVESGVDFEKQTLLFLRLLLLVLACGIGFQVAIYSHNGVGGMKTFLDALNLVTVAVPPALPLALSVGISVALARLKSFGIFCSDSSRIAAAGRVNCLCFDKTGTLTTDGLTLKGVAYLQLQLQQQEPSSGGPGNSPAAMSPVSPRTGLLPPKPGRSSDAGSNTNSSSNGRPSKTLGSELTTDVAQLHVEALTEGVRSKAAATTRRPSAASAAPATAEGPPEVLQPASNHRLLLSYVLAGCHSISTLEETDEATALVLRCNSEIITDPSFPELRRPETLAMLRERGMVEELLLDPERDGEPILVKVEVDEPGVGGGVSGGVGVSGGGLEEGHHGEVGMERSLTGSGAVHLHHLHHPGNPEDEEEEDEVVLDLPTLATVEGGTERTQHLVGDSLEILCFQESGWRYCVRPTGPPNLSELLRSLGPGAVSKLFRDGRFDGFNIWRHPRLAPFVETVLLPPASLAENRHASALAMIRRFDFDSELRRMSSIVRTLPNLEALPPAAAPAGSKRGLVYDKEGQHFLLVKGAPESIKDICRPETLPVDLEAQLQRLTLAGYRVLACGARSLEHLSEGEMLTGAREALEAGLTFVGLLVMENSLKDETERYLRAYHRAGFRQLMVTGDNPLTALAVSKMAGNAFLCSWRRPLLVDLAPSPANLLELRLCVSDTLDPALRWDLLEYLRAQLGDAVLLLPESEQQRGGGGGGDGNENGGGGGGGGRLQRQRSRSASVSASGPPVPPAPPLAEVDFVCTGRAFAQLGAWHAPLREEADPDGEQWTPLEVVLLRCNVFARMSPQNKQDLMRALQAVEYVVAMTGDGANDSGALKAADIGISIASAKNVLVEREEDSGGGSAGGGAGAGERGKGKDSGKGGVGTDEDDDPENAKIATEISAAEAAVTAAPSIAAPFATGIHHIGAVETVVTEGRGALANSFSVFKFMFLYGIIQFCGVLILYMSLLELAPMQYLWADLFVVLPLVSALPSMEALPRLTRGKPEGNLVSAPVLCSVLGHTLLIIAFQLFQQWMLLQQPWCVVRAWHMPCPALPYDNLGPCSDFLSRPFLCSPPRYEPPDHSAPGFDRQNTVASSSKFLFSNYGYVFLAVALCQTYGRFREPVHKNILLSALIFVELAATVLLTVVDWPVFDHWFTLRGSELTRDYRHKLVALGLGNGLAFIAYERFVIPHQSLDEDPVTAAPPGAILTAGGYGALAKEDGQGGGDATGAEDDAASLEEQRRSWLWRGFNAQPNCFLPRLGHKTPLYQKGSLAFA